MSSAAHYVYSQDAADAVAYWRDREVKVFAVDVTAGPNSRPSHRFTLYARARTSAGAIGAVQRDAVLLPKRARFQARLAGPRELGCVPTEAQ